MKTVFIIVAAAVGLIVLAALSGVFYTVDMTKQAIITEFGKPIGDPITDAGLHFKKPIIQEVNYIEKRILEWDGTPKEMPTKDKTYIIVDTFARWRISDAMQYFKRLNNERRAQSRLDDILGSETRNAIAKHELIEVIRTTKDREPAQDAGSISQLYPISVGRSVIEADIFKEASVKLEEFGIELLDIRFKRINYNESVQRRIYDRMISERQQIAERFRSQGAGEAAKINGKRERDLKKIQSEAYREVQKIRGEADARATEIYARAYNQSRQAIDFYEFIKTMETYEVMLQSDSTLILTTDSDIYQFLNGIEGN
jgi:membrane protease subunit HflC